MIARIPALFVASLFMATSGSLFAQDAAAAAGPPAAAKSALVARFYPLGELVNPPRQFPTRLRSLTSSQSSTYYNGLGGGGSFGGSFGGGGGGLGGGGLGGGGFGGGQGMFSVPVEPQFGGGGGFGGAIDFGVGQTTVNYSEDQHEAILNLIMENIDPDSWDDNGGQASITSVNNILVIRQTEENHNQIESFLRDFLEDTVGGQPLSIDVWWIPANAGTKRNLDQLLQAHRGDNSAVVQALDELNESSGGYHGSLQCRNRVTSNLNSGHRVPLIISSVPVVGNSASEHNPVVSVTNIGINLQVTPRIQERWNHQGIRLEIMSEITTNAVPNEPAHSPGDIDRFTVGTHVLETNLVCQSGVPVVAGGLTAVGLFPGDEEDREMVLVVLVQEPATDE